MFSRTPVGRALSVALATLLMLGCQGTRPLARLAPSDQEVHVMLGAARDLRAEHGTGDSISLRGVREIRGRIARVQNDSVWLLTGVEPRRGIVEFSERLPFATVAIGRGEATFAERRNTIGGTALTVGIIALAVAIAFAIAAASSLDFGS